jgi:predicted aldo/keto reductase-like oxidoreductase
LRGGNLAGNVAPAIQAVWDEAVTKRSAVEWSLRWIWNHPEVTLVLSGMNQEDHIDENIRIAGEAYPDSLSDKELALVERVEQTYRSLMKAGCTGCRYCMPCPAGVDIPTCFEVLNDSHMFGKSGSAKLSYLTRVGGAMGGESAYASLCENCGQCEDACPQHLPIQDLLKDVAEEFEKWWLKPAVWLVRRAFAAHRWITLRRARRDG